MLSNAPTPERLEQFRHYLTLLARMQIGTIARFICPAEIAYGDRGSGALIKPGAALVFEMELFGVDP